MVITCQVNRAIPCDDRVVLEVESPAGESSDELHIDFLASLLPDPEQWEGEVAQIGTGMLTVEDGFYTAQGYWIRRAQRSDLTPPADSRVRGPAYAR